MRTMDFYAWWRIAPYIVVVFCLSFMLCITIAFFGRSAREAFFKNSETMKKIPIVNNFLAAHSRKFDKDKDKDLISCCICMEEFSENDSRELAELNCSSKHVFHLQCL